MTSIHFKHLLIQLDESFPPKFWDIKLSKKYFKPPGGDKISILLGVAISFDGFMAREVGSSHFFRWNKHDEINKHFQTSKKSKQLEEPIHFWFLISKWSYIQYEYHTYIITVSFETFRSILFANFSQLWGLYSSIRFRTATASPRALGWLQLQTSSFVVHLLITKHQPELWFRGMYIIYYIWNKNTTLNMHMCVSPVVPFCKFWANLCSNHPKNTVVLSLPVTWNQAVGQKRIILSKPKSFILDRFPAAWTWSWQRIRLKCFFNDVIYRESSNNWLKLLGLFCKTSLNPRHLSKKKPFWLDQNW